MEWYYAEGGQQQGPVSEEEFGQMVASGKILPDTLVWHAGMTNWQPYRQVGHGTQAAPSHGGLICSQCGNAFAQDEVIRLGDSWVCGACKPMILQRMREGGPGLVSGSGTATPEELLARDYTVDVGGCLNRAWDLYKTNVGSILGPTVLVYLAMIAANLIPYLSTVLAIIFTGPLMGGLWLFYLKHVRGEGATVGDAFSGFGPRFGQLILANVVSGILSFLCLLPGLGLIMMLGIANGVGGGGNDVFSGVLLALIVVLVGAGFAGYVYLATCWFFTLPLVADKGMSFWPAMNLSRQVVIKHWWGTLGLTVVSGLLVFVGVLFCGVGALLTGPVAMGMLAYHYQEVFGDLQPGAE